MTIAELIWDDWNIRHIARHNVIPEEVEEVCESNNINVSKSRKQTYRIIGKTLAGRYLFIILALKGRSSFYIVTARDATFSERKLFKRK